VGDLGDDRARLDLLSMSDDDQSTVRAVFDGSYRRLPCIRRSPRNPVFDVSINGHPEIIFVGSGDVIAWWDAELSNLAAITRWAANSFELPQLAILLQCTVVFAAYHRGRWTEALTTCEWGLTAARRAGDRALEAASLLSLAETLSYTPDRRWGEVDATPRSADANPAHRESTC
jgi:hypothetical protein